MRKMIFLYTGRFVENPKSGSAVRPIRMLEAFREIGFEVTEVLGYSDARKLAMASIRKSVRDGVRFEFCYMETTTMPIALGDPGHFPTRPLLDIRFIMFLRAHSIPVFVFYRDVHWVFPFYGAKLTFWEKGIALMFYRFELQRLGEVSEKFYIPSIQMNRHLPEGERNVDVLPPGCSVSPKIDDKVTPECLNVLYVGGISPPVYDISDMAHAISGISNIRLRIICREVEMSRLPGWILEQNNIEFNHLGTKDLNAEYSGANVASLYLKPNVYFDMSMPVKLFEAIGYGVPILARSGTAAGEFVSREGLGWVVDGPEEARVLLVRLRDHPEELLEKRDRVRKAALMHTWAERARKVVRDAEWMRTTRPVVSGQPSQDTSATTSESFPI